MMAPSRSSKRPQAFLPLDERADTEKKTRKKKRSKKRGEDSSVGEVKDFVPYSRSRGIVYLSHLPHGLYEKELRGFLGQFGAITNLRVGRSKRTGQSKGYAFVEFRYPEVAAVVCETMNNYLMFNKLLKCDMLPPEKVSRACFRNKVNPTMPPLKKARLEAKRQVNMLRTEEQNNRRLQKQLKGLQRLRSRLEEKVGVLAKIDFAGSMSLPTGKSPVMEVDEDDDEVRMKTPPNVRKVKSRSNSVANSAAASHSNTPKGGKRKPPASLQQQMMAEAVTKKLLGSSKKAKSRGKLLHSAEKRKSAGKGKGED